MADQSAQQLFQQAVAAARNRQIPQARQLIQASIRKDPNNHMAWMVLASIAENKREKLLSLKKALELDPGNAQARKMIHEMGLDPDVVLGKQPQESAPAAPQPAAPPEPSPQPPAANLFSFQQAEEEAEAPETGDLVSYNEQVAITPDEPAIRTDSMKIVDPDADLPPAEPAVDPTEPPKPEPRPDSFEERLQLYTAEGDAIAQDYMERGETPPA